MRFFTAKLGRGGHDFLLLEGINRNVEHINQYYQRTDAEIQGLYNRPYFNFLRGLADRFVVESTR